LEASGWEFYSTVPNSLLEIGGCARDTYWDGRACLGLTHLFQASAEHFQQCAEFLPLRNRGLGALAAAGIAHSVRQEGRRYRLRRRAIDSAPFSSQAAGRASRSSSALRYQERCALYACSAAVFRLSGPTKSAPSPKRTSWVALPDPKAQRLTAANIGPL
jgi:hypothetical protein